MADEPSFDISIDSPSDQPQLCAASSSSQPVLTRNTSLSKLNARAPEFVPLKTQPTVAPRVAMTSPSPSPSPPPIGVQVYAPANAGNQPFHAAPVQQHHVQYHHPHKSPPHHHKSPPHHLQSPPHHHHHHQSPPHHHQSPPHHHQSPPHQHHQKKNTHHEISGVLHLEKNGLSEEASQKIINQVEFYFSDVNLATTDHLIRFINKDPEGYVPISVVASFKKIKALVNSNFQLAAVLRNSTKLAVTEDGKKVKRLQPLTTSDMEELQCRIVIAENLPDDHCYQNLMKVFSSVGSVKSIRTCQPQASNSGVSSASKPSKTDNLPFSNKVHAFVEYESIELAEKAVAELNAEGDWRNGLRVRLLLKRTSKSAQSRGKKAGNEGEFTTIEEDDTSTSLNNQDEKQPEGPSGQSDGESQIHEHVGEDLGTDKEGGQKRNRSRGRGKGRGRGQNQNNRSNHVGAPATSNPVSIEHPVVAAKPPPGPRMPDGTRGFSMGRGKPVTVNTTA